MSYGKYGFKPTGRASAGGTDGYQDPWVALGAALGKAYANNYAQRGTDKAIATGTQALEDAYGGGSGQSPQAMMDAYNATQPQAQMFAPQNPQLMGENPQLPMPKGTEFGRGDVNSPTLLNALTQKAEAAQMQDGMTRATQNNFYAGQLEALHKQGGAKFDQYKAQELINGIAQQKGLVGDERARFFEAMAPVMGRYQKQHSNDVATQKLGSFKAAMDSGDYNAARGIGMELLADNPQMATAMLTGVPNPVSVQTMNYNAQRLAQAQQLAAQQAEANKQKAYRMEQKESITSMQNELKWINNSIKTAQEDGMDENGVWKSKAHEEKYLQLKARAGALETVLFNLPVPGSSGSQQAAPAQGGSGATGVAPVPATPAQPPAQSEPGLWAMLKNAVSNATSINTAEANNRRKNIEDLSSGKTTIRDLMGIPR